MKKPISCLVLALAIVASAPAHAAVLESTVPFTENYSGAVQTLQVPRFPKRTGKLKKAVLWIKQKVSMGLFIERSDASTVGKLAYQLKPSTQLTFDVVNPGNHTMTTLTNAVTDPSSLRGYVLPIGVYEAQIMAGPIQGVNKIEITHPAHLQMLIGDEPIAVQVSGQIDATAEFPAAQNPNASEFDWTVGAQSDSFVGVAYSYE